MDTLEILKSLTACTGTPGAEKAAVEVAKKYLEEYGKTYTDKLGNLICEIDGKGKGILLDAHIDRVGLIVTSITPEGFLHVGFCGGIDERTLLAQQVTVHSDKEIKGVIISTPPHLQGADEDRKTPKIDDILVDIGMSYDEASAYVKLGDRITVDSKFLELAGDRVASAAFDDRCGMASILYALEILKSRGCNRKITVAFSTREEVGGSGARVASYNADCEEFIAVDVSFAKTPDSKAEECGVLGNGPMIGYAASLDKEVSDKLKALAIEKRIPYQLEIMGGRTGTNADSMSISGSGYRSGLVSIPLRYMHTGVEVISKTDIENVGWLIAEYIFDGGVLNA